MTSSSTHSSTCALATTSRLRRRSPSEKTDVNGADAHPLFKWMKSEQMIPAGDMVDTKGNGCADEDALVLPRGAFGGSTVVLWTPVARSDIAWNFEKFLIGPDGAPV